MPRCVVIGEGGPKGPPLRPWEASPRFRVSAARDGVLLRLNVDPAFELLALPAAGARVVRVGGRRGARLAADARVAEVVERQQRDVVVLGILPDVACRPPGDRRDAGDRLLRQ